MSNTHRSVLRDGRGRRQNLTPVSIRLAPDLWQKCDWAARAVGLDRTAFVRNTLTQATRDAQPPSNAKNREILASDDEWKAWDEMASEFNTTIDHIARKLLNGLSAQSREHAADRLRTL